MASPERASLLVFSVDSRVDTLDKVLYTSSFHVLCALNPTGLSNGIRARFFDHHHTSWRITEHKTRIEHNRIG